MRQPDFRNVDLNLLVLLEALLEEKNVTRAAARLGMSQPAASRALGRLRRAFSDPLLVDGPGGYVLSARAEDMRPRLRSTLAAVGELLDARPFDPASATGAIRLLMPDLQAAVLVPPLIARLSRDAPGLDVDIVAPEARALEALEEDRVDAVVGLIEQAPAGIHRRELFREGFVTLLGAQHPRAAHALTLDTFLALDHIVVSVTGRGIAPVDEALARRQLKRRVRLRVPNFIAAMEIVARSDLAVTLPASLARMASHTGRFALLQPPVELGTFAISLVWHARHQHAPRHQWLRQAVVEATAEAMPVT